MPVTERAGFPALLEQPQVVGAFVVARIGRALDRIPSVGVRAVLVFLDVEVVAEIVELDVAIDHQASGHVLQS